MLVAGGPTMGPFARSHLIAQSLLNKLFSYYDELSYVFGKDCVMRGRTKTFVDVESNDHVGYKAFSADAAPDIEFQPMYNQGLDLSPNELMGTRTARLSEGSHASSGFK
ncbi:retrotransposon protein [Cucumis melo var. makuwa]|uniref:Retrotransposon protein n=1 Tax=Cucumis melo var. makuwa TaxID=1194695 RepID=A0A5A7THK6_CUCMM|nr:retrotransposon protein [Cucumis melo var. makuwa]